jgi:predicted nucleotidyltransferase
MEKIIKKKLEEIEKAENVKIILAVESGSRAWGFESKDSDYDVRFIYIRKTEDYLKLEGNRDVIEWQLDDLLDINGWDIQKALRLLYKSNPVLFEWCHSPIVYKENIEAEAFKKLAADYFSPKSRCFIIGIWLREIIVNI